METINNYVDTIMDFNSTEKEFIKELTEILGINESNVNKIKLIKREDDSNGINLILAIHLVGSVEIDGKDLAKIEGTFISPKTIEIKVGEIHL